MCAPVQSRARIAAHATAREGGNKAHGHCLLWPKGCLQSLRLPCCKCPPALCALQLLPFAKQRAQCEDFDRFLVLAQHQSRNSIDKEKPRFLAKAGGEKTMVGPTGSWRWAGLCARPSVHQFLCVSFSFWGRAVMVCASPVFDGNYRTKLLSCSVFQSNAVPASAALARVMWPSRFTCRSLAAAPSMI